MFKDTALYVAERSCPSISYRIRKEILDQDMNNPNMQLLQSNILKEEEILRIFSLKKEDGWLGGLFHGVDEPELYVMLKILPSFLIFTRINWFLNMVLCGHVYIIYVYLLILEYGEMIKIRKC